MTYPENMNHPHDPNSPSENPSPDVVVSSQGETRQTFELRLPKKTPYVTFSILGLTVFVFLLQILSVYLIGGDLPAALMIKSNKYIQAGQIWRLITPILLHDDSSILHIGFNMYALFVLGPNLERFYGHFRFLILYLVSGFAGILCSFVFSESNSLGASTSIFGLIAAELIFVYLNRHLFGSKFRSALSNILIIIVINLGLGFTPGIDMFGHLGGLIGGLAFAWFTGPVMVPVQEMDHYVLKNNRNDLAFFATAAIEISLLCFISALVIYLRR